MITEEERAEIENKLKIQHANGGDREFSLEVERAKTFVDPNDFF